MKLGTCCRTFVLCSALFTIRMCETTFCSLNVWQQVLKEMRTRYNWFIVYVLSSTIVVALDRQWTSGKSVTLYSLLLLDKITKKRTHYGSRACVTNMRGQNMTVDQETGYYCTTYTIKYYYIVIVLQLLRRLTTLVGWYHRCASSLELEGGHKKFC